MQGIPRRARSTIGAASRPTIALVLVGAKDLSGGGGAERYFADLFRAWSTRSRPMFDLVLVSDRPTLDALASVARPLAASDIVILPHGGRLAVFVQSAALLSLVLRRSFAVVHLAQALPRHLPWLWISRLLPVRRRPRIALNINDARLAHALLDDRASSTIHLPVTERLTYDAFFRSARLDAVMSWYRLFIDRLGTRYRALPPLQHAARFCFVDTARFQPATVKRPWCVFSGRLVEAKRPLLFLEAIAEARASAPAIMAPWRFFLFGDGPLRTAVKTRLATLRLEEVLTIGQPADLATTLAASSLFVSTQDHENFTSLAMLEAMASGNAIIARDVGQTPDFVQHGRNGLLVSDNTSPAELAKAICAATENDSRLLHWGRESRRIATEVYTADNALGEFERFWTLLLE